MLRPPPRSTLFPYTTLFRSTRLAPAARAVEAKSPRFVTPDFGLRQLGVQGSNLIEYLDVDRKSTRLNSSHTVISYAVFCLKKKKTKQPIQGPRRCTDTRD